MRKTTIALVAAAIVLVATLQTTCNDRQLPVEVRRPAATPPAQKSPTRPKRAAPASDATVHDEQAPSSPGDSAAVLAGEATTTVFPEGSRIAQPEHVLKGRVVNASGEPIAGIRVVLASCWLPQPLVENRTEIWVSQGGMNLDYPHVKSAMTTDASGRFRLRYYEGGGRTLYAQRKDHSVAAIVRGPSDAALCIVTLADGAPSLDVRVVRDTDGQPVPGAVVKVQQAAVNLLAEGWSWVLAPPNGPRSAEGTTDAEGRCRLVDLVSGPARVEVFGPHLAPILDRRVLVPCRMVEVRLSGGYTLTGRVLDAETGGAIAGARVSAVPARVIDETVATTDNAGRFTIEHVPASRAMNFSVVSATARGYAAEQLMAGFIDETRTCEVTFAMHRSASVRVRCLGAAGAPLPDAIVAVISRHMGPRQMFGEVTPPWFSFEDETSADTDAAGRATMSGLHPGGDGIEVTARFYLDGVAVLERTYAALAAGETRDLGDVVLVPGLMLSGTLLDADGRPAGGASVAAAPTDPPGEDHAALGRALIGDSGRLVKTRADGGFTFVGLAPGLWDLYAAPEFGAPGTIERGVDLSRGNVTLHLPRLVTLAGRVVDARGDGVPRARVSLTSKDFFGMAFKIQVLCDEKGRFEVGSVAEGSGEVDVEVSADGSAPQRFRVLPGANGIELRLR